MSETQTIAAAIAAAYFTGNKCDVAEVPDLVRSIAATVAALQEAAPGAPGAPTPPAGLDPRRTVFNNHIVCLECAGHFQVLRGHLTKRHRVSVEDYLRKWSLPDNYPVVAPDYAKVRRRLAMELGLGRVTHVGKPKRKAGAAPAVKRVPPGVSGLKKRGRPPRIAR